ncbi:uncharacterized protein LOC111696322 isoform X2 [Eurytemora carolleeae]|uniref:uncharacterized protein LOC111696322 isoform X2 n=1 Tax=Eurytemora carolleeae TaxID=1294199 RepID=UPI000C762D3C|nr:uncharacterized protein LOC111696322 isoform X2 [Eurytemora carolleeae]|eukprot:XP_023321662.1 uncharacterized protein LOC111696322 isoform X2 [Eurytemora affinis]
MAEDDLNFIKILQVIGGLNVLLLHAGLALLEAGVSQRKNVSSVLTRQLACLLLSTAAFWICGYGFAFGGDYPFIGNENLFVLYNADEFPYSHYFVHSLVASLPSSILGGAVAERTHITGHLIMSSILTGFICPVVTHWLCAAKGWLRVEYCIDLGGTISTHVLCGTASLSALLIIGRRMEKFGVNHSVKMVGHSLPIAYIGGFMMIIGMIGKAVGLTADNKNADLGAVVMNCLLAAAGAGSLATFLFKLSIRKDSEYNLNSMAHTKLNKITNRRWSFFCSLNGTIAGLVAIHGGVGLYHGWAAWVVGLVAGALFFITSQLLALCRLDDATDAVSVHLGAGIWGAIATPLLARTDLLNPGKDMGFLVGWELAGVISCFSWTATISAILLLLLLVIGKLRVDVKVENHGADIFKIQEQAYPSTANHCDVTMDGVYYNIKSPGLSPFPFLERKPLGITTARNASCTAVVPSVHHELLPSNMTSTQKLENMIPLNELSRTIPKIIIGECETQGLSPEVSQLALPPTYIPAISVSHVENLNSRPSISPGLTDIPAKKGEYDYEAMKLTLSAQKKRLKSINSSRTSDVLLARDKNGSQNSLAASPVQVQPEILREIAANAHNFNYLETSLKRAQNQNTEIENESKGIEGVEAIVTADKTGQKELDLSKGSRVVAEESGFDENRSTINSSIGTQASQPSLVNLTKDLSLPTDLNRNQELSPEVDLNQNQILNQDQILNQNQIVNQEQILNQERKTRAKERKERKEEILKKLRASKEVINESPLI